MNSIGAILYSWRQITLLSVGNSLAIKSGHLVWRRGSGLGFKSREGDRYPAASIWLRGNQELFLSCLLRDAVFGSKATCGNRECCHSSGLCSAELPSSVISFKGSDHGAGVVPNTGMKIFKVGWASGRHNDQHPGMAGVSFYRKSWAIAFWHDEGFICLWNMN